MLNVKLFRFGGYLVHNVVYVLRHDLNYREG